MFPPLEGHPTPIPRAQSQTCDSRAASAPDSRTPLDATGRHWTPPNATQRHPTPPNATGRHPTPLDATGRHPTPPYATPRLPVFFFTAQTSWRPAGGTWPTRPTRPTRPAATLRRPQGGLTPGAGVSGALRGATPPTSLFYGPNELAANCAPAMVETALRSVEAKLSTEKLPPPSVVNTSSMLAHS